MWAMTLAIVWKPSMYKWRKDQGGGSVEAVGGGFDLQCPRVCRRMIGKYGLVPGRYKSIPGYLTVVLIVYAFKCSMYYAKIHVDLLLVSCAFRSLCVLLRQPLFERTAQASGMVGVTSRVGIIRYRGYKHACAYIHAHHQPSRDVRTMGSFLEERESINAMESRKERNKESDRRQTFKNSNFGDTMVLVQQDYRRSVIWMQSKIKLLEPRGPSEKLDFPFLHGMVYACVHIYAQGRCCTPPDLPARHGSQTSRSQLSKQKKHQQRSSIMVVKVAINGFGRIGRCLFRFLWDMSDVGEEQYIHTRQEVIRMMNHRTLMWCGISQWQLGHGWKQDHTAAAVRGESALFYHWLPACVFKVQRARFPRVT